MLLTILGSGTARPVAHRGPTALWVRNDQTSLLVDCGSGALQKLYRAGGDLETLDAVLLTHAHLDHLGDLPTILFALKTGLQRRSPLLVYHSRALAPYLDGLAAVFGDWLGGPEHVRRQPLRANAQIAIGGFVVDTFEVSHHETSLGYRLRDKATGRILAIPSDTGLCLSLLDAVRGADALVLECATTDEAPREGHLAPSDVLHVLAETQPGAAVLTHQYPEVEAAGAVARLAERAACPVLEAADGMTLRVDRGGVSPADDRPPERTAATLPERSHFPDEAAPVTSRRDRAAETAAIHALLDAELEALDRGDPLARKYERDAPAAPGDISGAGTTFASRVARHWTAESVAALRLTRAHRRLLKRVAQAGAESLPQVNLRGLSRDDGLTQLKAAVETWASQGIRYARVVTGKGRHSEDVPVLKVAALDWLDGLAGGRLVAEWAPEFTKDGNFGAVLIALRR